MHLVSTLPSPDRSSLRSQRTQIADRKLTRIGLSRFAILFPRLFAVPLSLSPSFGIPFWPHKKARPMADDHKRGNKSSSSCFSLAFFFVHVLKNKKSRADSLARIGTRGSAARDEAKDKGKKSKVESRTQRTRSGVHEGAFDRVQ